MVFKIPNWKDSADFLKNITKSNSADFSPLKNNSLFEVSWEVCNKVGGIYTVVYSKLKYPQSYFNKYFLIGPFFKKKDYTKELEILEDPLFEKINLFLKKKYGFGIVYGQLKDINIKVVLIDYLDYSKKINEIKGMIWEIGQVDSLNSNWYDFDEVILWSWTTGIFLDIYKQFTNENVIGHFHEWMSGGGIFYLKKYNINVSSVFTTHSTVLGRALSYNNENLYEIEYKINPDQKAEELGIKTKHQTEKALANLSDKFTTVSNITAEEAEIFLKKPVDNILYNGFYYPNLELLQDINILHKNVKTEWLNYLNNFFNKYYKTDLKNNLLYFISGRNEIRAKGVDVFINSLGKINKKYKNNLERETILKEGITALFLIIIGNFKKKEEQFEFKVDSAPYSIYNIGQNQIYDLFIKNGLLNRKEDFVKVQLIPIYLDKNDNFMNKDYYELISGLDYGFFPSYYEPWGYTPLESSYFGVKGYTTDLTGFGRFILRESPKLKNQVIKRVGLNDEIFVKNLTREIDHTLSITDKEFLKEKKKIFYESKIFSWNNMYKYYLECYLDLANKNN